MHTLSCPSEVSEVTQLIVIGRGMASDFEPSNATYERAIATARYCAENPQTELVVFSSGYSSLAGDNAINRSSEASVMADIARLPTHLEIQLEETSTNTLENFIHSSTILNPDSMTGVLAHTAHLPRALFVARKVLDTSVLGISAEAFGATPECPQSIHVEKIQLAWMKALLFRVKAGDLESIRERNEFDKRVKHFVGNGLKKACTSLKRPMLQQYQ